MTVVQPGGELPVYRMVSMQELRLFAVLERHLKRVSRLAIKKLTGDGAVREIVVVCKLCVKGFACWT